MVAGAKGGAVTSCRGARARRLAQPGAGRHPESRALVRDRYPEPAGLVGPQLPSREAAVSNRLRTIDARRDRALRQECGKAIRAGPDGKLPSVAFGVRAGLIPDCFKRDAQGIP